MNNLMFRKKEKIRQPEKYFSSS